MTYTKSSPPTIEKLFSIIASRYDLCNKTLSFNLHKRWNRKLVNELIGSAKPEHILDLCAGTGDIAFEFKRQIGQDVKITLLDFCAPMLDIAKTKAEKSGTSSFTFIQGDATILPFEHEQFSHISIAYGIRNVQEPLKCVSEAFRVLKKGGHFGILELTRPQNRFISACHSLYLKRFVPLIGGLLTKNKEAYEYLNNSIHHFSAESIKNKLESVGFQNIKTIPLNFGIASIITARK